MRRRSKTNALIHAAWIEWLVTKQVSTGDGSRYVEQAPEIPQWFRGGELGFALGAGPSLEDNLETLEASNRHRRRTFERSERQLERAAQRRRVSVAECQRDLRKRLRKAGVTVRAGEFVRVGQAA